MSIFKSILGWLGVVLGAAGIVLSLAAIIGMWWVNGTVTTQVLRLFPPIETALTFGDQTATQFEAFVGDKQTQFDTIADAQPVATALADEIARVGIVVDVANGLVDSAESTLSQFSRTERLTTALSGVDERLDSAGTLAQEIRDGRTDRIDALNTQLNALETEAHDIQTAIDETASDVASMKQRVPRWIGLGSFLTTLLLLWFGFAQYCLLRNSWRWVRRAKLA